MELAMLKCVKCGHEWVRRMEKEPVRCPKCQTIKWR